MIEPRDKAKADALADLKATWRAQSLAVRGVMALGAGVLVAALVAGALGLFGPRTAPATATVPGPPPVLALEQGEADPAAVLRRIAGGAPVLNVQTRWIGILKEEPVDPSGPAAGRTAQFDWQRRPYAWTTITVFGSWSQANAAYQQVSGGPSRDILMPNPDGVTQYVDAIMPSPDGETRYPMRCAARPKLFYCAIVPEGVAAIVTVKLRIDTEGGPEPGAQEAKGAELTREMGLETDQVMRSLGNLGLDGRRAVAR